MLLYREPNTNALIHKFTSITYTNKEGKNNDFVTLYSTYYLQHVVKSILKLSSWYLPNSILEISSPEDCKLLEKKYDA